MKASDVRNWLGIYFLLTTILLGAYILLFGETALLPINKRDSSDAFQIIIPVFVAQLTTVFTWFTNQPVVQNEDNIPSLAPWIVKAPPLLVLAVIAITIISMIISERPGSTGPWIDASTFKNMVTFSVTILNATVALVVVRYFGRVSPAKTPEPAVRQP